MQRDIDYKSLTSVFIFLIVMCMSCSAEKDRECVSGPLFSAHNTEYVSISKDQRQVLRGNWPQVSQWATIHKGDRLVFSIGFGTTPQATREDWQPVELNREVLADKDHITAPLSFEPPEPGPDFDAVSWNVTVKVENDNNHQFVFISETIEPKNQPEYQAWVARNYDLAALTGLRVRFIFTVKPFKKTTNIGYITTPLITGTGRQTQRNNVFIVSLDTLRADHTGCYGYPRSITPFIDWFAKHAVQFTPVITPCPWTLPTHISLLTGLAPRFHRVELRGNPALSTKIMTVPELMSSNGFNTFAFTGGGYLGPGWGLGRGFQRFDHSGLIDEHISECLEWLDLISGPQPFFSFIHTYEIHTPYNFRHPRSILSSKTRPGMFFCKANVPKSPNHAEKKEIIDNYDEGIRYTDEILGLFFRGLVQRKLFKSCHFVILSDHGEEFYEHGLFEHGTQLYNETLEVPLLWKKPDQAQPHLIWRPVSLISIVPSLLTALDIAIPEQVHYPCLPHNDEMKSTTDAVRLTSSTKIDRTLLRLLENKTAYLHVSDCKNTETLLNTFDLENDPQELSPERLSHPPSLEFSHLWAELQHKGQLWISSSQQGHLKGTITFNDMTATVILNSAAYKIHQGPHGFTFDIPRFMGQIALQFTNSQGSMHIDIQFDKTNLPCSYTFYENGAVQLKNIRDITLPISPFCSNELLHISKPPIIEDRISLFAFPDDWQHKYQGSEKPTDDMIEQIRALGYIE